MMASLVAGVGLVQRTKDASAPSHRSVSYRTAGALPGDDRYRALSELQSTVPITALTSPSQREPFANEAHRCASVVH